MNVTYSLTCFWMFMTIVRFVKCYLLLATLLGYEPADLTVHPPPPRMIEGGLIFFGWVSSATKFFSSKKKVDFAGDIKS